MNVNFLVNGRCFKTLCKTVLNAECFTVLFSTEVHTITANISDKCYFTSIDHKNIDSLKTDFYFNRNFKNKKEFITKLEEVVTTFINTSITEKHFHGNIDKCISKILDEIKETKRETAEAETATETELETATEELLAEEQFERLTRALYKSLFKAIGLKETKKIPFIISNNMVFFNYNGMQYKYNPAQWKLYKKDGHKYQRINWKNFADDNSPTDQKQALGRSPPLLLI